MSAPRRLWRHPIEAERGAFSLDLGPGWNALRIPLALVALAAIVNVGLLLGVTLPRFRSFAAADTAARAGEQAQATLEPQLRRARSVYGSVLDAERSLLELRRTIGGASGSVSEIVATLRAAVDAAGLDAPRIGYGRQPVPEMGLMQLQIDLPVTGTYRQLRRFLDELFDGPMFVVVERVGASTPGAAAGSRLQMSVTASVFVATAEQEEPAAQRDGAPAVRGDPLELANRLAQRLQALPAMPLPASDFVLTTERLERTSPVAAATRRNLFEFVGAARPDGPLVVEEPEDTFVPEPVMPYELIGMTHGVDGPVATLSDGDQVYLVRGGELLPDGLRVAAVGRISVDLEAGGTVTRLSLRKRDEDR